MRCTIERLSKWYQKAAEGGNPAAQEHLADIYGLGLNRMPKDHAQELKWREKSCGER